VDSLTAQKFKGLGPAEQAAELLTVAQDPRPRAASGIEPLDDLLNRRSFGAGELVVLGGRMHTRKTGVVVNIIHNLLKADVPVGLVGLDESPAMYVAKLASVMSAKPHTDIAEFWGTKQMAKLQAEYAELATNLSVTKGYRPDFKALSGWLQLADVSGKRPRVVVIDYLALLARAQYQKGNAERIQNLAEDLQVWTNDEEVTTIVLHQVGRQGDNTARYHGDTPMTPEQLMYGGEQVADIIISTYRPALNPVGNMSEKQALAEGHTTEEWEQARELVEEHRDLTMLQLTKNRPGVELNFRGIKLQSAGRSQRMTAIEDRLDERGMLDEDAA
jgi:KaiC/GvpD/RAD55 family RecA-like ATPase